MERGTELNKSTHEESAEKFIRILSSNISWSIGRNAKIYTRRRAGYINEPSSACAAFTLNNFSHTRALLSTSTSRVFSRLDFCITIIEFSNVVPVVSFLTPPERARLETLPFSALDEIVSSGVGHG